MIHREKSSIDCKINWKFRLRVNKKRISQSSDDVDKRSNSSYWGLTAVTER